MKWPWSKSPEVPADPAFDEWTIVTPTDMGEYTLHGRFDPGSDQADVLRYVYAIVDGLRRADIEADLTLTRRVEVKR